MRHGYVQEIPKTDMNTWKAEVKTIKLGQKRGERLGIGNVLRLKCILGDVSALRL